MARGYIFPHSHFLWVAVLCLNRTMEDKQMISDFSPNSNASAAHFQKVTSCKRSQAFSVDSTLESLGSLTDNSCLHNFFNMKSVLLLSCSASLGSDFRRPSTSRFFLVLNSHVSSSPMNSVSTPPLAPSGLPLTTVGVG